jgi:hypothetical protein
MQKKTNEKSLIKSIISTNDQTQSNDFQINLNTAVYSNMEFVEDANNNEGNAEFDIPSEEVSVKFLFLKQTKNLYFF